MWGVYRLAGIAAALVLATGCAGGGHRVNLALRHPHWFAMGERACGTQVPSPLFNPAIYPARFRGAVVAGCRAASR
jgi:hypothetical protein